MERQTLRDWVHHYNESGIDRLLSRESTRRRPFLTQNQRAELKERVIAGPSLESHGIVRWRCVDLHAEAERRFDVRVFGIGQDLGDAYSSQISMLDPLCRLFERVSIRAKRP